jgi:hypothetical protein
MSLRNEDRELQIRLAELQADVQINLTICFGLLAIIFAVFIGLQQIHFTVPPENIVVKNSTLVSMVGCVIIVAFVMRIFFGRAIRSRKQIEELRKRYVW